MAISKFKALALQIVDKVSRTHESIIITKRGKPLAKVIPFKGKHKENKPGRLAGTLLYEKDIIGPIDEKWDADS